MRKPVLGVVVFPVEKAAVVAMSKVTGLSESEIAGTWLRLGMASTKDITPVELRNLAFSELAKAMVKQSVHDELRPNGTYVLTSEDAEK